MGKKNVSATDTPTLEERVSKIEEQLGIVTEYIATTPDPPEPEAGSIIKFYVQFDQQGPVYSYAAYRIGGAWAVTGKSKGGWLTWEAVLKIMRQDYSVKNGYRRLSFQVAEPSTFKVVYV